MKIKIIGIFIGILIISSIVLPVAGITNKENTMKGAFDTDVPTWKVGNQWTYHFIEEKTVDAIYRLTGELTFKCVDDSDGSYVLEAKTKPQGNFDLGGFGLKTTTMTTLSMMIQMRQSDLALEKYQEQLKGFLLVTLGSITLPIPLQVIANIYVEFDPPWAIIPFPLFDGKNGMLDDCEFLHIQNYMHLFWGLIPLIGPADYSFPITAVPYTCSEEQITVQGETYDVFNVTAEWMEGSRFVSYYCEEVGNVVKEVIYLAGPGGKITHSLTLELTDWSLIPIN